MNKEEWTEGLKKLEAILKDAKDTYNKASKDIEELNFTISCYKNQISKMKD
jgi:hypothetical protein